MATPKNSSSGLFLSGGIDEKVIGHAQFSKDEEELVVRMYNLVGARWALIAGRIPGRSAEEIEKYWASRYSGNGSGRGSGQIDYGGTATTLVEFTLSGPGSMDSYDVSLVNDFNLPQIVDSVGGSGCQCPSTGCAEDLNKRFSEELRTKNRGACGSACNVFNTTEY